MKYLIFVLTLVFLATSASGPLFADLKILFESGRDNETWSWFSLFMMDPDGSNPVNLSKAMGVKLGAVWSPDGTKVLYSSGPNFEHEILMMDLDNSNVLNLTNDPGSDSFPRWSPDGTLIAWNKWPPKGLGGGAEIFTMDADGSNPRNLGRGSRPKWSRDGTMIGFTGDGGPDDGFAAAFVMNADGSGRQQVTNDIVSTRFVSWSRDGTKIAFYHRPLIGFNKNKIYVVNLDGTGLVELTKDLADIDHFGAAWSPDGTKIAFYSSELGLNWSHIYVVNTDGTNRVNLTIHHPLGINRVPQWSPDGREILFQTKRDGNWEIYLMNADGSDPVNLTNNPFNDEHPAWFRFDLPTTSISPQDNLITTWGRMKYGNQ